MQNNRVTSFPNTHNNSHALQPQSLPAHQYSQHYSNKRKKKPIFYSKIPFRHDVSSSMRVKRINQDHLGLSSSAISASKIIKNKNKSISMVDHNIIKKSKAKPSSNKHTISVVNFSKHPQDRIKANSNMTKRKHSAVQLGERIKQKIEDFRILAGCLEEYVKEERKNHSEVNLIQIIKMIKAFNRSQIASISKPLEKLILDIVQSIQNSLPIKRTYLKGEYSPEDGYIKSILKKQSAFQFDKIRTKKSSEGSLVFESSPKVIGKESIKTTVKKAQKMQEEKEDYIVSDVKKLEDNLSKLKYQSNRLKNFYQEIAAHSKSGKSKTEAYEKEEQLRKLKQIAQEQARLIESLDDSPRESNQTFRSDSDLQNVQHY